MSWFVVNSIELLLCLLCLCDLLVSFTVTEVIEQKSIVHPYRFAEGGLCTAVIIFSRFSSIHGHLLWDVKDNTEPAERSCEGY